MHDIKISKKNIEHNIRLLKNKAQSNNKEVLVYLKNDAYGYGTELIFKLSYENGLKNFLFGDLTNAIEYKKQYPNINAYVFNTFDCTTEILEKYNIIPVIHSQTQLEQFRNFPLVINVTMSLNSIGFTLAEYKKLRLSQYNIKFIMSHLSWIYEQNEFQNNISDIKQFNNEIASSGYETSLCSSRGFLQQKWFGNNKCKCNIIRAGGIMMGCQKNWINPEFKDVIEEISFQIAQTREVNYEGNGGYGQAIKFDTKYIGYIDIGYLDGFSHNLTLYYGDNLEESVNLLPQHSTMSLTWVPLKYPVDRVYLVNEKYNRKFEDLGFYRFNILSDLKRSNQITINYL